jgi:hypothetical protein
MRALLRPSNFPLSLGSLLSSLKTKPAATGQERVMQWLHESAAPTTLRWADASSSSYCYPPGPAAALRQARSPVTSSSEGGLWQRGWWMRETAIVAASLVATPACHPQGPSIRQDQSRVWFCSTVYIASSLVLDRPLVARCPRHPLDDKCTRR